MKRVFKRLLLVLMLMMIATPLTGLPKMQVEAASTKVKLTKPSNLRLTKYINRGFVIKWDKVSEATGYEIYVRKSGESKYKKVGATKKRTFQITKLKANTKYRIRVRAYLKKDGKTTYGKFSGITHIAYNISNDMLSVHGRYIQGTAAYTTKVTLSDTGKKVTLKAGSRVTIAKRNGNYNTVVLSNGKTGTVLRSSLYRGNLATTTKYYTQGQKELFVNARGYSSKTNYLIWINQYTCNVTIFKGSKGNWKQIRSMPCVVGRYCNTPVGVYRILYKVTGLYGTYGLYFTGRIGYGNAFHARVDANTRGAYSGGCVRLGYSDLAFMYNTCPVGTTVVSY